MKSGKTLKVLFVAAAVTAFAAGCGSDGSGSSGTTLNTAQMQAYSQEMGSAVSGGITSTGAFTFNSEQPDHHNHHPSGDLNALSTATAGATVNCAAGGTSTVTGSLSYTVGGSTLSISALNFTVVFNGCEHVGTDGVTYTINTPSAGITVDASGTFTSSGGEVSGSLSMTEVGTVDVTGTNLSVSCSINVSVSDTETNNASTVDVTGTACGNTVNKSFSY